MYIKNFWHVLHNCAFRFLPRICDAIRPFLPPLSVLVTACCVGAPLAINIESVLSPFGLTILLLIITFHMTAFIAGYFLTGMIFHEAPDVKALQRTLSYETGHTCFPLYKSSGQSSLLYELRIMTLINYLIIQFFFLKINSLLQGCKAVFWPLHLLIDFSKIHLLECLRQFLWVDALAYIPILFSFFTNSIMSPIKRGYFASTTLASALSSDHHLWFYLISFSREFT